MGNNIGRSLSIRGSPADRVPVEAVHEVAFAFGRRILMKRSRDRRAERRELEAELATSQGMLPTFRLGSRAQAALLAARLGGQNFTGRLGGGQSGRIPPGTLLRSVIRGDVAGLEVLAAPPIGGQPRTNPLSGGSLPSGLGTGSAGASQYLSGAWAPNASPSRSILSANLSSDVHGATFDIDGNSYTSNDGGDPLGGLVDGFEPLLSGFSLGLASNPLTSGGAPSMQAARFAARSVARFQAEFDAGPGVIFSHSFQWSFGDGSTDSANESPAHQFVPGVPSMESFVPSVGLSVTVTDPLTGNSKTYSKTFTGGSLLASRVGRFPTSSSVGGNNDVILTNHNGDPVSNCRVLCRFEPALGKPSWGVYVTNDSGSTGNLYGGGYGKIKTRCMRNLFLQNELDFGFM